VTSLYSQGFEGTLSHDLSKKISFDGIDGAHYAHLDTPSYLNIMKTAIDHSDGVIEGSPDLSEELSAYLKKATCPVLNFHNKDEFSQAYIDFYKSKVLGA
jgi:starch synthase